MAEQQLSLAAYDVLVQLAEAPEHRLRMTELADAVLLSRSGVTRLVDRLEKAGWWRAAGSPATGAAWPPSSPRPGVNRLRTRLAHPPGAASCGTSSTRLDRRRSDAAGADQLAALVG